MAATAGVERDVLDWFEAAKITYKEVAPLTTDEKDVMADIVDPMGASEPAVNSTKTVIGFVNIKKFWIACRGLAAASTVVRTPEPATDAPIP